MGEVTNFHSTGTNMTINQWCDAANCDNATITRRIKVAKISPAEKKGKLQFFALRDLITVSFHLDDDGRPNPAGMDPFKRKAHFQAAQEEIRYLEECGELIPKIQYQDAVSRVAKIFTRAIDSIPDKIERLLSLKPPQVQLLVEFCNKERDEMAEVLAGSDDGNDTASIRESSDR